MIKSFRRRRTTNFFLRLQIHRKKIIPTICTKIILTRFYLFYVDIGQFFFYIMNSQLNGLFVLKSTQQSYNLLTIKHYKNYHY